MSRAIELRADVELEAPTEVIRFCIVLLAVNQRGDFPDFSGLDESVVMELPSAEAAENTSQYPCQIDSDVSRQDQYRAASRRARGRLPAVFRQSYCQWPRNQFSYFTSLTCYASQEFFACRIGAIPIWIQSGVRNWILRYVHESPFVQPPPRQRPAPTFHKPSSMNARCLRDIPPELLLLILGFLDAKTLLLCSAVCTSWQEIVKSTTELQYTIELMAEGMVQGDSSPLTCPEALKALRDRRRAWRNLEWTSKTVVQIKHFDSCAYELVGSVFAQQSPGPDFLSISLSRLVDEPENAKNIRSIGFDIQDFQDFRIDPSQDLQLFPKTLRQTFYFASAENFDGC
ncbi:hypothetical protein B0H13DRAFT_2280271 [Mycena leptocephala]|nr:hypothetical protein B0H13DRAFT_2280271 [Mycena leptocephala]